MGSASNTGPASGEYPLPLASISCPEMKLCTYATNKVEMLPVLEDSQIPAIVLPYSCFFFGAPEPLGCRSVCLEVRVDFGVSFWGGEPG